MNNNIIEQVYSSFGVLPPEQRAVQPTDTADVNEMPVFVDMYQQDVNNMRTEQKKTRPRGSSPIVLASAKAVISGDGVPAAGLAQAYKRAKEDRDMLKSKGEPGRADIVVNQYMEEHFLPAVETIIRYSSPDELLNCKSALSALDKLALGTGSMVGYTASYVRSAYGDLLGKDLDSRFEQSDPAVRDSVQRIKALSASDKIRSAIGVAKQIKKQIDDGECIASEDDYGIIARVVAYAD
jgi:hypothetical protein